MNYKSILIMKTAAHNSLVLLVSEYLLARDFFKVDINAISRIFLFNSNLKFKKKR